MHRHVFRPALALLATVLFAALACPPASAQSGRRPPPRRPDPAPETPAPTPAPTVSAEADAPAIAISAGKINYSFNLPDYVCDDVFRACVGRIEKSARTFKILSGGGDMNRKKATDLAKSEKETYVLLIEFSLENDMSGNSSVVIATYTVFTPGTGKSRVTSRVYFDAAYYNRGVGSVVRRSRYYTPQEAGEKIAEDVMGSLSTVAPGGNLPMPR